MGVVPLSSRPGAGFGYLYAVQPQFTGGGEGDGLVGAATAVQISILVPGAVWPSYASRQRLEEAPISGCVVPTLVPLPTGAARYMTEPCPGTLAAMLPVVLPILDGSRRC